jgi:hypothetical protein
MDEEEEEQLIELSDEQLDGTLHEEELIPDEHDEG